MAGSRPILIIGGTRGTGLLIARLLDTRGSSVRVMARAPAAARVALGSRVDVVPGDITRPETLPPALDGAAHIIFTAGCRSGHPASEARIKATEYEGVLNTLESAARRGFPGRFMYMTASGVRTRSWAGAFLNLYKGNTLVWRLRAETAIREAGFDYTIVRTGMLVNAAAGTRAVRLTQKPLPLSIRDRIARADVAEAFVAALEHSKASRATFEIIWTRGDRRQSWPEMMAAIKPDAR